MFWITMYLHRFQNRNECKSETNGEGEEKGERSEWERAMIKAVKKLMI